MSYFLFVDESGIDHKESPYEVLAGIAVEDRDVWNVITQLHSLEYRHFGRRVSDGQLEIKAKKLLKRKVFRLAGQLGPIPVERRKRLAKCCLEKGLDGSTPNMEELTALCQAKIAFVSDVMILCSRFRIKAFSSIILPDSPRPETRDMLRKDYAFLFERFFYFLEDRQPESIGVIVFDELERSRSHILVSQMESYFLKTAKGQERSSLIIPEPFFVHSDLTTLIQMADLVAYIISWGVRIGNMTKTAREELSELAGQVCRMRHKAVRERGRNENYPVWSFAVIDDLRPVSERH